MILKKQNKLALMHDALGLIILFAIALLVVIGLIVISNNKLKDIVFGYL